MHPKAVVEFLYMSDDVTACEFLIPMILSPCPAHLVVVSPFRCVSVYLIMTMCGGLASCLSVLFVTMFLSRSITSPWQVSAFQRRGLLSSGCLSRCVSQSLAGRVCPRMALPRCVQHLSGSGWVVSGLVQCLGWCPCPLGGVSW